jgi:hypothetical protein
MTGILVLVRSPAFGLTGFTQHTIDTKVLRTDAVLICGAAEEGVRGELHQRSSLRCASLGHSSYCCFQNMSHHNSSFSHTKRCDSGLTSTYFSFVIACRFGREDEVESLERKK